MSSTRSAIPNEILKVIESNGGEVDGSEVLSLAVGSPKWYVLKLARNIAHDGMIIIIPSLGGRGRKTKYKRNRNSPGQPRRK